MLELVYIGDIFTSTYASSIGSIGMEARQITQHAIQEPIHKEDGNVQSHAFHPQSSTLFSYSSGFPSHPGQLQLPSTCSGNTAGLAGLGLYTQPNQADPEQGSAALELSDIDQSALSLLAFDEYPTNLHFEPTNTFPVVTSTNMANMPILQQATTNTLAAQHQQPPTAISMAGMHPTAAVQAQYFPDAAMDTEKAATHAKLLPMMQVYHLPFLFFRFPLPISRFSLALK